MRRSTPYWLRRFRHAAAWAALSIAMYGSLAGIPGQEAGAVQYAQSRVVSDDPVDWTPWVDDGYIESIAQVGSKIIAGGSFTTVRAAGSTTPISRTNLFSFDATTGAIDPAFNPVLDGVVNAVVASPDGQSVIVGGQFGTVNGVNRKIVTISVATGQLVPGFSATVAGGPVTTMAVRGNTLFVGGRFGTANGVARGSLAAFNATTGALDNRLAASITGTINGGTTFVDALDVTPDGSRMVIVGNFTTVDGQTRGQVAQFDLTTDPFSLANWRTTRFEGVCANVFTSWVEDVDYSPDGSYFALVTSGAFRGGVNAGVMCDTASRWETYAVGTALQPTWTDYTGGDTQVGVAVTATAVYTGGHQRWENNPFAGDAEGPGSVARQGLAALDPVNGLPFTWNPSKGNAGGSFRSAFLGTPDGLWFGTDVASIGRETHNRLAFFPLAGGTTIPVAQPGSLPGTLFSLPTTGCTATDQSVLYRVNAGGPTISAVDCGPNWLADNATGAPGSAFRNSGSNASTYNLNYTIRYAPSGPVPTTTPRDVFATERWDPSASPEMNWDFPVAGGAPIEVRLYFANQCDCTAPGGTTRAFDVRVDGNLVLDDYNISADVGHRTGTMRAFQITSDGNVDIDFSHVTENPLINAIEIVRTDRPTGPFPSCPGTDPSVLHRINAAGPTIPSLDCGPDWLADNATSAPGFPFHNTGSNTSSWTNAFAVRYEPNGPVPRTTPSQVYASERWDPNGGNEMSWDFRVPTGAPLQVRLYFANQCDCTGPGGTPRAFDVRVDGALVLDDYNILTDVGHRTGTVRTFNITGDGNVDVDFTHVSENPLVNAIEIVRTDVPSLTPTPRAFLLSRSFDGTTPGSPNQLQTPGVDWTSVRGAFMLSGTLYTGMQDGTLFARSFDGTTLGPATQLNPYVVSPGPVFANVTGVFFWNGAIYYTVQGDPTMHYRYFTPESGIVGAVQFNVPANGFNWAQARATTMADGKLYWATTDGNLHSAGFSSGAPVVGTDSVLSGPSTGDGQVWGGNGMFVLALPTAGDTQAPTPPTQLRTTSVTEDEVALAWDPATDDVGVTAYEIHRNGSPIATVPNSQTTYVDDTVAPGTFYSYEIVARDAAGNVSQPSNSVNATTPGPAVAFSDGFESGNMSQWTTSAGMSAQTGDVFAGTYAGDATANSGNNGRAFASKTLPSTYAALQTDVAFEVISQGANAVNLLRLQTATGANIVTVSLSSIGNLTLRNDVTGTTTVSNVAVPAGAWRQLELVANVQGASSTVRVTLDGSQVNSLTQTLDLGTTPIGRLIIGDNSTGKTFQVRFDDVSAEAPADAQAPSAPTNARVTSSALNNVSLAWDASTDNVGVTSYEVRRDGSPIATVAGSATTYDDGTVAPGTSYTYEIVAKDAAGNVSQPSNSVNVTTTAIAFSDGFESGTMSQWTTSMGMAAQTGDAFAGTFAGVATANNARAFAWRQLASTYTTLTSDAAFKVVSQGANAVNLLRLQTAAGANIATVFLSSGGNLSLRNDVLGTVTVSNVVVAPGAWRQLELSATIQGASSTVRVMLDGSQINALTQTINLGTTPIGRVFIGDNGTKTFQVRFDEVRAA